MHGEATLYQFPLYPFYISIFYKFFGFDPRYVLWSQIFVSVIFINIAVRMCRSTLGGYRFLLGLLLCIDLHQVLYSSCLLTELWVMLFWVMGLLAYFQYRLKRRFLYWCLSMAIFTIAANIKPLSLFLPLFLSLGLGLFDSKNLWHNLKLVVTAVLIFVLGMLPLLYRNYLISDQFPLVTTTSALNLWYYNIPYARSKLENRKVEDIRIEHVEVMRQYLLGQDKKIPPVSRKHALGRHEHRKALELNEFEYAVIANKLSSNYLQNNFFSYSFVHIYSGLHIFTTSNLSWLKLAYTKYDAVSFGNLNLETLSEWYKNGDAKFYFFLARIYELGFTFLLLGCSFFGGIYLILKRRFTYMHWAGWLMVIYLICITGVNTWGRFRFLIMPIMIYLGVEGIKFALSCLNEKCRSVQQTA